MPSPRYQYLPPHTQAGGREIHQGGGPTLENTFPSTWHTCDGLCRRAVAEGGGLWVGGGVRGCRPSSVWFPGSQDQPHVYRANPTPPAPRTRWGEPPRGRWPGVPTRWHLTLKVWCSCVRYEVTWACRVTVSRNWVHRAMRWEASQARSLLICSAILSGLFSSWEAARAGQGPPQGAAAVSSLPPHGLRCVKDPLLPHAGSQSIPSRPGRSAP